MTIVIVVIVQVVFNKELLGYSFIYNKSRFFNFIKYGNNRIENRILSYKIKYKPILMLNKIEEKNKIRDDVENVSNSINNKDNEKNNSNFVYDNMDLFVNDGLQLKQWYSGDQVRKKWEEKHIENVKNNYEKVLLNNKYNELFNMYRNIKKNNVENHKKRVKTNRINPVIYIKKRLVSATAKYLRMSFIKTRKILWKIRYMPIIKAFAFLYYYGSNKYTVSIYKCIKSCLHNAICKYGKNNIKPVFHTLQANMGGYTKKINIRAKGKTDIIREPHTHIRVVLEV
ncbi:50S ribosomal protein L22 [Plasmodium yoelii yoelii]|nr:50S ribosomal protein L22 [Plasmodium yoelii yoelii]